MEPKWLSYTGISLGEGNRKLSPWKGEVQGRVWSEKCSEEPEVMPGDLANIHFDVSIGTPVRPLSRLFPKVNPRVSTMHVHTCAWAPTPTYANILSHPTPHIYTGKISENNTDEGWTTFSSTA